MQIPASTAKTTPLPDDRESSIGSLPDRSGAVPDSLRKVAQDFEAIFMSMMLKELRNTGLGDGLFAGDNGDMLGSMFDQYLGEHLAEAGGLGVAQLLAAAEQPAKLGELQASLRDVRQTGREAYRHAVSD